MKTNYKHIHFKDISQHYPRRKTQVWECWNSEELIGRVQWYARWRQYCFGLEYDNLIFAKNCLDDISHFITQLMDTKKKK